MVRSSAGNFYNYFSPGLGELIRSSEGRVAPPPSIFFFAPRVFSPRGSSSSLPVHRLTFPTNLLVFFLLVAQRPFFPSPSPSSFSTFHQPPTETSASPRIFETHLSLLPIIVRHLLEETNSHATVPSLISVLEQAWDITVTMKLFLSEG